MAKFVIKQTSGRGVSHPVVARLVLQIKDAITLARLDQETKDSIFNACRSDLSSHLGKCWDIWDWLEREQRRCNEEYTPSKDMIVQIPQIHNLEREIENFLYEAKNFLRDLLNNVVSPCFPEIDFSDARSFFDAKSDGDGPFVKWAETNFGADDGFTKMLREDQVWIKELVRKRNCIEHPNGKSGVLTVQNIEAHGDGRIIAPVWQRTGTEPEFISIGLATYCHHLLSFAEEVILFGCILKNSHTDMITFSEIPEEDRDAECPIRFRTVFKDGFPK
ncbi:MAG: hypothetical protein HQ494_14720 [Rhodospirillales bacterium]|nr:hypothetical protein [Rhodospirillales bacterium]